MTSGFILEISRISLTAVLIIILILFVSLRRNSYESVSRKRISLLFLAILIFLELATVYLVQSNGYIIYAVLAPIPLLILLFFLLKKPLFHFKSRCSACQKKLGFRELLGPDNNLCENCLKNYEPKAAEIRWDFWRPKEIASLCYIISDSKVLLINKKTGLGKGMVNGPGGHIEKGETAEEAAIREVREEVGLEVRNLKKTAELYFHFTDGLKLEGHVFITHDFTGEPKETEEASPFWCAIDKLPFDKMWEDDILWLDDVLAGKLRRGKFVFDGEKMIDYIIEKPEHF